MLARTLRWMQRLGLRTLGIRERVEVCAMDGHAANDRQGAHVDPQALAEDAARREARSREALASVRSKYHKGTQPLTVARARADVMRRLDPGEGEGVWQRKPS